MCSAQTSGTFTSPNGQFSLTVSDTGVEIVGPDASIRIDANGLLKVKATDETISVQHDRSETVGHNETVKVGLDRAENVSGNETISVSGNRSDRVSGSYDLSGATLGLNGGPACRPVARVGDMVDSTQILTGSPTVCIG